jgi:hypothetical protein
MDNIQQMIQQLLAKINDNQTKMEENLKEINAKPEPDREERKTYEEKIRT